MPSITPVSNITILKNSKDETSFTTDLDSATDKRNICFKVFGSKYINGDNLAKAGLIRANSKTLVGPLISSIVCSAKPNQRNGVYHPYSIELCDYNISVPVSVETITSILLSTKSDKGHVLTEKYVMVKEGSQYAVISAKSKEGKVAIERCKLGKKYYVNLRKLPLGSTVRYGTKKYTYLGPYWLNTIRKFGEPLKQTRRYALFNVDSGQLLVRATFSSKLALIKEADKPFTEDFSARLTKSTYSYGTIKYFSKTKSDGKALLSSLSLAASNTKVFDSNGYSKSFFTKTHIIAIKGASSGTQYLSMQDTDIRNTRHFVKLAKLKESVILQEISTLPDLPAHSASVYSKSKYVSYTDLQAKFDFDIGVPTEASILIEYPGHGSLVLNSQAYTLT